MPLPLAPLLPIALRIGVVAAAGWALRRATRGALPGRTDQRAEDALDDLPDGLSLQSPRDRSLPDGGQTNAGYRLRRLIRWGNGGVEVDAVLLGRLRLRRV